VTDEDVPSVVRELIADRLDSIPELEAVLLLREESTRTWTPEEAGKRLYVSTTVAAHILQQLHVRGLLLKDEEAYRYGPESEALTAAVTQLAVSYSRNLIKVTHIVHSKPSQSVRDFANAFRLRKPL
jgi:hypothetical protein